MKLSKVRCLLVMVAILQINEHIHQNPYHLLCHMHTGQSQSFLPMRVSGTEVHTLLQNALMWLAGLYLPRDRC